LDDDATVLRPALRPGTDARWLTRGMRRGWTHPTRRNDVASPECRRLYHRHGESGVTGTVTASRCWRCDSGMEARQGGDGLPAPFTTAPVPVREVVRSHGQCPVRQQANLKRGYRQLPP